MRVIWVVCLSACALSLAAQKKPNPPYLEDIPPPSPRAVKSISIDEQTLSVWIKGDIGQAVKDINDQKDAATVLPDTFMPRATFPSFGSLMDDKPSSRILYVLHISVWNSTPDLDADPLKPSAKYSLLSSRWFAFRYYDKNFHVVSADHGKIDLLESKNNAMLVSLVVMEKVASTPFSAPCMAYKATSKERTANNVLALEALIGGVLGIKPPANKSDSSLNNEQLPLLGLTYRGQTLLASRPALKSPFDITYVASATPGTPDAADPTDKGKFKPVACDPAESQPAEPSNKDPKAAENSRNADGSPQPTAPTTSLSGCNDLSKTSKCSLTQTVSVEQEQWWDVGVNAPFRGPQLNKYTLSQTDSVAQSHTLQSVFMATLDLSPWAHAAPMSMYPYLQVGVPLTGAAFHLPYAGLSQPLPFTKKWVAISLFGGVSFMKQSFPRTLKVGESTTSAALSSDLKSDWARKPIYGIEIPVSQAVSKIKAALGKGSGSTSSTKGAS